MAALDLPQLRSHCPISFSLDCFGDRWSLLILRDVLIEGRHDFRQMKNAGEGIASNVLTDRLARLEAMGLIERFVHPDDRRVTQYLPTDRALNLVPVLVEMAYWGGTHDDATAAPEAFLRAYESDRDALCTGLRQAALERRRVLRERLGLPG